jgi:signal transduction histidine kinase
MIKKRIKELLSYIFANKEYFSLEHRLFLSTIVYGILVCILGSIVAAFLTSSKSMVIIGLLIFCIFCAIYYFVRFKRIVKPFIVPIIVISFIGISAIWIFGGGINGSNIIIWFVALILAIIVSPNKLKKYVITLFLLLVITVYLIQFYLPDLIIKLPSENKRWMNSIITITYSSVFIYFIIRFLLNQYTLERKRAEENEKRLILLNADKDRFISILGHDLKNPFNNILGLSEVLTDEIASLKTEEIEDIAKDIHKSATITNNLLDDILMWAKTQQGKIPFNPLKLSFADICKNTIGPLNSTAHSKNITIDYSTVDNSIVYADIDMLKTVLRNLVSNAIKFTNNGGAININAEENSENTTISVSDNGVGIPTDNLAKLFDISEVLTTKGTAKETGTGLGLLLCREFVEKHGGKIWVESEVGKGSDFKFTLPKFSERVNDIND